jgi:hypothetical protein
LAGTDSCAAPNSTGTQPRGVTLATSFAMRASAAGAGVDELEEFDDDVPVVQAPASNPMTIVAT